jgi:hypothetical protein
MLAAVAGADEAAAAWAFEIRAPESVLLMTPRCTRRLSKSTYEFFQAFEASPGALAGADESGDAGSELSPAGEVAGLDGGPGGVVGAEGTVALMVEADNAFSSVATCGAGAASRAGASAEIAG